ncbi:MAG TPA: NAD(P)-dependent oxidoreductase [Chloroflexota bacterium]|jgi:phosphoglycerate dehydrogenase-like enzyme
MSAAKVFIFAPSDPSGESHRQLEAAGCEVALGKASWHTPQGDREDEIVSFARDCDAMCGTSIRSTPITRRIMESADKLRIVGKYTIGCDDVDVEAATQMGIMVTHSPTESNWGGVAEGAIANMLCLLKKLRERDTHLKSGGAWRLEELTGTYLGARASDGYKGLTIGLIGLGRHGGRVAQLLRPWRVRILAYDPYISPARFLEHDAQPVDLATLLAESDVVSMHCYLSKETRHMMGDAQFRQMKPTAIFLNQARGPIVDEQALARALQENRIAAAALDVFEIEPLPMDSPLRQLGDKVMLSPHMISSNTGSGLKPGVVWTTESVLKALRGEVPNNVFNPEVIPAWQQRFGGRSVL